MSAVNKTTNRLQELDALRGIAALSVVFFHFTKFAHSGPSYVYGVTGVELFFIISGFVIFMSINSISEGREFIANRVARLYPTYWACVLFTFSLQVFTYIFYFHEQVGMSRIKQFLVNLTMFQYYFKVNNIDGVYWTLIVEMVFYIFIYLLFVGKLLKYIEQIGVGILIALYLMQTMPYASWQQAYATANSWFPLLSFFGLFFSGIVFYKMYSEKETVERYAFIIFCFIYEVLQYQHRGFIEFGITQMHYIIILLVYYSFFILFIKDKLKFIVSKPTLFLGTISYALYLVHQFMSVSFLLPFLTNKLHLNYWIAFCITLPIVIAVAAVITYYIEVPLRKKLRKGLLKLFGITQSYK